MLKKFCLKKDLENVTKKVQRSYCINRKNEQLQWKTADVERKTDGCNVLMAEMCDLVSR